VISYLGIAAVYVATGIVVAAALILIALNEKDE
jgi:hypothetical protein